jgi:hypothetical protein
MNCNRHVGRSVHLVPIVLEMESDADGQAGFIAALVGASVLLRRHRDACDFDVCRLREMEGQSARSRSDIEDPMAWAQQLFCSEMPFLVLLGISRVSSEDM